MSRSFLNLNIIRRLNWVKIFLIIINTVSLILIIRNKPRICWKQENYSQIIGNYSYLHDELTLSFNPAKCLCRGENFCFKGIGEDGKAAYGRAFSCKFYERLERLNLLDKQSEGMLNNFNNIDFDTWDPVFMTLASSNHFNESKEMIDSVRKFYPTSTIFYYDVGLDQNEKDEIRSWNNTIYRQIKLLKYPAHLANIRTYAFKIAQVMMFRTYKSFFYLDTSIRLLSKLEHLKGVQNRKLPPVVLKSPAPHSIYAMVHPGMLEYLPMPKLALEIPELESGAMFITDSAYTRRTLKWWYLCAMTQDCIAPIGSRIRCTKKRQLYDAYKTYLICHRFDQAYYNIAMLAELLGNERLALDYGYIKKDWTNLTEDLIKELHTNRMKHINYYTSSINVTRWERTKEKKFFT